MATKYEVVVVVVPFPAQGHLNQLLHFSSLISSYNIQVHYVSTKIHTRQAKIRAHHGLSLNPNSIHFHEFSTPSFPSPPPNPNSSIKFPSHLQPSFESSYHLRGPVASLVRSLSSIARRVVVVHDSLMAYVVQDFTSLPNAESYNFHSVSAFTIFLFLWESMGKPFPIEAEILDNLPSLEGCFTSEFMDFMAAQRKYSNSDSGNIYNTSRVIEGKFMNLLEQEPIKRNKTQWAIGPFNPVMNSSSNHNNNLSMGQVRHKCLSWLDKQSPKSVIFISFGTTTSLKDEQIKELCTGLEKSGVKFIWALRDADKGDIFSGEVRKIELPKGYEERVVMRNKGIIVRDWAPQLEILGHLSIGAFMSHCGWNSCMESLSMGVPIIAWPMHSDQPRNGVLITKFLRVVHYVTTTTHTRQVNFRVHGFKSRDNNIQFHEFPTPIFNSPTPYNNNNPNSSTKFPSHLQPSSQISTNLRKPVSKILRSLSHKTRRIIIIHDSLMGSVVQDHRKIPNAEAYTFHSVSAFTLFLYVWESMGRPFSIDADMIKDLPSIEGCFSPEFDKFVRSEHEYSKFNSGKIYNTSRVIEGTFLDFLSKEQISKGKKQWALGPFNPIAISEPAQQRHRSLIWLDKQVVPKSVMFVSFGTTTSFSDEQINEIAIGLEQSQQKFIWVLRDADKENVFSQDFTKKIELPKGFEDRVKERGIVVRDWAPQLEILAHTSTGGFLSHCGWNSCMESISMGVPLATWPMHSDQPRNTTLITKILKLGLVIKDWARRDELVMSDRIEKVVRILMASQQGEEMRKKAQELSFDVKKAMGEGGVTKNEFDSFIAHITR
ncbi:hypothetical protein HAX54_001041 [Datura stramonium]|uniref:Glycosyltransferase N-terminal domain-containing protein n=1 Tax=Datura stramonium TaxID=4076 RepID=A0ABS8T309_DATST|nr:hypothetical protein [Datura stramonium]